MEKKKLFYQSVHDVRVTSIRAKNVTNRLFKDACTSREVDMEEWNQTSSHSRSC